MKIPILPSLESRQQWLTFSAQEVPYAYISQPQCLVDLQSSFLQITLIDNQLRDGREALKYSLGSKRDSAPTWRFIESCQWSLAHIVKGLSVLSFDSNVRDNSLLKQHSDISVRQFFAKDKCIVSPVLLQPLRELSSASEKWELQQVQQLLLHRQYTQFSWLTKTPPDSEQALLLQLISYPNSWKIIQRHNRIILAQNDSYIAQFSPAIGTPTAGPFGTQPQLALTKQPT
ncbi:MAG: hypothetical protein ACPG4U_09985 [Pseudomonadales bacterium]